MNNGKLVFMPCGHCMEADAYNKKLDYFAGVLTQNGGMVGNKTKPEHTYDYSYIITGFVGLTKEIQTALCRANLKAEVNQLLENTAIVSLKQITFTA